MCFYSWAFFFLSAASFSSFPLSIVLVIRVISVCYSSFVITCFFNCSLTPINSASRRLACSWIWALARSSSEIWSYFWVNCCWRAYFCWRANLEMPFLLKIAPLGTGLSSFSALGNSGRHAASTFCYHSELNSIISFGKYPLFEQALRGGVVRASDCTL